uniref:Glutathione-disulfide reductase n=1 Tax=Aureoumbra lagunensis TaxID=44058 RepID=A0A7S3K5H0_9STRA
MSGEVKKYDVIVIGGGSGGSAFSRRAAGYGAKVAIIDRGVKYINGIRNGAGPGGTCVNVGCVPKKVMFMAAGVREMLSDSVGVARGYGYEIKAKDLNLDWSLLKSRRDAYVDRLSKGYVKNWNKAGVDVIMGTAKFVSCQSFDSTQEYVIEVTKSPEDGGTVDLLRANRVVIAVGGKITMPNWPGIEYAISSDGFFDMEFQPRKVAVIGAGYIAVEMAGILHALGSETHLFFRGDTVLRRGFDPFVVEQLMQAMKAHGPELHPLSTPNAIIKDEQTGTKTLVLENGSKFTDFDCILVAIGREPLGPELQVPSALKLDPKGYIVVDDYENTSLPNVYAIGDATTTGFELTPVAIAAGRRLADRLYGGEPRARIEYFDIATVVFSHPPIGTVGLTEPEACLAYGRDNVTTKQSAFNSMIYALNENDTNKVKTGLKLVLAGPEEKVVGLHCIGPFSDEMLQGFAVSIRMGATRRDFEASVAIHPTIAEEFVTFGGWGQKKRGDRLKPWLPPYLDPKPNRIFTISNALSFFIGAAAAASILTIRASRS